jgi:alkaline phosphatase D
MKHLMSIAFSLLLFCGVFGQNAEDTQKRNLQEDQLINPLMAPFYHGVASGDPLDTAVIIWTRVTPDDLGQIVSVSVFFEVADDVFFNNIVKHGVFVTDTARDFTVKIDVTGLLPDTYYFYRFMAFDKYSVTGRTKTTPSGNVSNIKLAVLTGSDYTKGYFSGLTKISQRNDIDAVIHTGDYIYEHGTFSNSPRTHIPDAEIYVLQDYRTRLSQYRLDSSLQRCHQLYPWIIIWDDHDIVVDALRDTSYRHNPAFGSYTLRKYSAVRAFREWIPCRDPLFVFENDYFKNWKHIPFGGLMDLYMVDSRLYDRDRFADNIFDTLYNSPLAKIIGPEQLNWLKNHLTSSNAQWKFIGNGLMFSQFTAFGYPLVLENWDGYSFERNQILDHIKNNQINNIVFLSGDFHCSFAIDVAKNPYNIFDYNPFTGNGSLAVEFLPPSLTSDNFDEGNDFGLGNAAVASGLIQIGNPHIKMAELEGHGYILVDITLQKTQAEFWYMADIIDPANHNEYLYEIWYSNNNENKLRKGTTISLPKPFQPDIPSSLPSQTNIVIHPEDMVILSCYPNPFRDYCYMNIVSRGHINAHISLYDSNLNLVQIIFNGNLSNGNHKFRIIGDKLRSGVYFLLLQGDTFNKTIRVIKQ